MGKIIQKGEEVRIEMSMDELLLKNVYGASDVVDGLFFGQLVNVLAFHILKEKRPELAAQINGYKTTGTGKVIITFLKENRP